MGGIIVQGLEELGKKLREKLTENGHIEKFNPADKDFIGSLSELISESLGLEGRVTQLIFDCGTPPPKPDFKPKCYRTCYPGKDDRPICTWVCT